MDKNNNTENIPEIRSKEESDLTFFEHLEALRPHLVRGILSLFVVTIVAFLSKDLIIDKILFAPQSKTFPTNEFLCWLAGKLNVAELCVNQIKLNLVNTKLSGQFNLHMTVSFVTGLIVSIPYLLWEVWRFIRPALSPFERKKSQLFVVYVSGCFFTGLLFGYYIISPLTINFLASYQASDQIANLIDVSSYLSSIINVSLASAAVFELPVLVFFLAKMRILKSGFMLKYRKHAIVVLAVFSAIITPPDVFSMTLILLPLYGLYIFSIRIAKNVEKKQAEKEALEAME